MRAYQLDSYAQGVRFSDEDDLFYDEGSKTFKDQAGFSGLGNDLVFTVGSPDFVDDGTAGRRGVLLDNTTRGEFFFPDAWNGAMIVVLRPSLLSGATNTAYVYMSGDSVSPTPNPSLQYVHFSGDRRILAATGSAQVTAPQTVESDDRVRIFAFSFDQSTRKAYSTEDGITVSESAEYTSNPTNGLFLAFGSGKRCQIGRLEGDPADFTVDPDAAVTLFEHHCFTENILVTDLDKVKAVIDDLKIYYNVT